MAEALDVRRGDRSTAEDAPPDCAKRDRPWVLVATILASAMGFIDGALLPIALPSIGRDLDADFSALQWISNIYLLSLSALIVIGGGLGDRIGKRRIFVAGVLVFAVASAACAAALTPAQLIMARALQGVGAALMIPQSLAIISASYPKAERGGAIGLWAASAALTTSLAPAIGGFFVDTLGWRAAFWVNLPLAALCVAISLWRMPPLERRDASSGAMEGAVDWPGAALLVLGLGGLSWALIAAPERGVDLWAGVALGVAVAAFIALPWVERRASAPIAPPALFASGDFLTANIVTLLLYGALGAALFLLPFDLVAARGYTAMEVGLSLTPLGLIIGTFSRSAGKFGDRFGPRALLTVGCALFAGACLFFAFAPMSGGYATTVLPGVGLMGVAMTIVVAPLTTTVMNAAPDASAGAASGVNNAVSRAAGLIAVAGVGALTSAAYRALVFPVSDGDVSRAPQMLVDTLERSGFEGYVHQAMTYGYIACAALALCAAVIAFRLPGRPTGDQS